MKLPEDSQQTISVGDQTSVASFTSTVTNVEAMGGGCLFISTARPSCVSSGKRRLVCRVEEVVRARGKLLLLPKRMTVNYRPIVVRYQNKKRTVTITAHSLNINGSGFITTDSVVQVS